MVQRTQVSELRFMELLDGLCKYADHYRLVDGAWLDARRAAADALPDIPRQQRQAEQRSLQNHCEQLLETHEEDLVAGLQRQQAVPVQQLLCSQLSGACRQAQVQAEL